jgi:PAS domain S-box-containing protein
MKSSSDPTEPATETIARETGGRRVSSVWGALLVLVAGLVFTSAVSWQLREASLRRLRQEFRAEARHRVELIRYGLENDLDDVKDLQVFYEASGEVNRDMFHQYAGRIAHFHGIQALEWIPRVTAAQREEYEAAARRDGLQDFRIFETDAGGRPIAAGQRAEYFPVCFLEPLAGNETAAGYDLASEPVRRAVLERARDTGIPSVTERITLVQGTDGGFGFIIFAPVYERGRPADTVEQRRAQFRGFVAGVFRAGDVVAAALRPVIPRGLPLQLLDLSAPADRQLLHEHKPKLLAGNETDSFAARSPMNLRFASDFEFVGRRWRVVIQPNDRFIEDHSRAGNRVVPLFGLALTVMLALYVHAVRTQHQKAEALVRERTAALRESEERFRTMADAAPVLIWMASLDKRRNYFNNPWLDFTGRTLEEEFGDGWSAGVHPDDFSRCLATYVTSFDARKPFSMEYRLRRHDGEYRWLLDHGVPRFDRAGNFAGYIGSCYDITERRQAAVQLADSERSYKGLFNTVGEAIYIHDEQGRFLDVNAGAVAMYGYHKEDFLGKTPEFLSAPGKNDLGRIAARMERAWAGEPQEFEWWGRRRDGQIFPKEVRLLRGTYFGRDVLIAVARDISGRKQVEEELRKSASLNRNLVAHLLQRVFIKDRASVYVSCNPSYARDLGIEPDQIVGKDDYAFFPRELADQYRADDQCVIASNRPKDLEEKYVVGGREIWIHTVKVPYHDAQGVVMGVLGIFADISERKRIETRTTALRRLGVALNEARDTASAGRAMTDAAFQMWNWDACFLLLYDAKTETVIEVVNMDTINGQHVSVPVAPPKTAPSPLVREVFATGPKLILRKDGTETGGTTMRFGDTARPSLSLMFVPIRYEQASIGIISVQSYRRDAFTEPDLQTLQVLADHCAGALARVQAEAELAAGKQRLDLALKGAELGLWDLNVQKGKVLTDDRFLQMVGYRAGEVDYDYAFWKKSIHPDDLKPATEALHGYLAGNSPGYESEYRLRKKSGDYCWVLAKGRVLERDAEGRPLRLLGTAMDITGRKQAEQTLRESEQRFASVFRASPAGVCIVRLTDDRIIDLNDALADMYGYTREEVLGRTALELNAWVDPRQREVLLKRALEQGPVREAAVQFRRKNGEVGEAVGSFEIIELAGERCMLVFARDITDFNRTQAALRQAQKMEGIGHLAGGVAHHFNNILAAMTLNLSLLVGSTMDPEMREALREMEGQAKRAATLVRQLLAFSRKSNLRIEPWNLPEVLDVLCRLLRPLLGEHITLDLSGATSPAWADFDRALIEQAVMNLCLNARDAMPKGGRLSFQLETLEVNRNYLPAHPKARPGRFVCLSVTDTGCGMDETTLQYLFEPFFTTKDVGKGTGLGLATAVGIVEQHQGWLEVESAVGKGSTFHVFLPAGSPPAVALNPPPPDEHTGNATIFLVEDEPAVRKSIALVLRRRGYRVLEAGDGKEALALWEKHAAEIDLLYADLILPEGLSGQEMAEMLRKEKPALKVIISSGYTIEPFHRARLAGQSIVYLSKPCAADELTATVRDCLRQPNP